MYILPKRSISSPVYSSPNDLLQTLNILPKIPISDSVYSVKKKNISKPVHSPPPQKKKNYINPIYSIQKTYFRPCTFFPSFTCVLLTLEAPADPVALTYDLLKVIPDKHILLSHYNRSKFGQYIFCGPP